MPDTLPDYRRYLDPRVLARVSSLDLRARMIVEGLMAGMHRSPYQGISVEFAQHRQYVAGDDIRHVDWKVYGKTDKIYLKQYLEETNLQLVCVVDASESMGYGTVASDPLPVAGEKTDHWQLTTGNSPWTKYDYATSIAAALAYMAIHQQDSAGLAVFDSELRKYFKPSNAPAQWKLVVHELQVVPRLHKTNIGRVLEQLAEKLVHRSLVVVLSDWFDSIEHIQQGLRRLRHRKHELIVFQVLDPAEIEFPFEQITLFKGLEEQGELLTEPRALREGYLNQLAQFTESLQKLCRGMGIDFARMDSGRPLDAALSGFLAGRGRR
jgi:uncharacterized protein (DUF58 family)